jgi:hypothetical protein
MLPLLALAIAQTSAVPEEPASPRSTISAITYPYPLRGVMDDYTTCLSKSMASQIPSRELGMEVYDAAIIGFEDKAFIACVSVEQEMIARAEGILKKEGYSKKSRAKEIDAFVESVKNATRSEASFIRSLREQAKARLNSQDKADNHAQNQ